MHEDTWRDVFLDFRHTQLPLVYQREYPFWSKCKGALVSCYDLDCFNYMSPREI